MTTATTTPTTSSSWLHATGVDTFACGCVSGIAKVVAGHPFDTIKSRVQSGLYPTPLTALRGTIRHEGAMALYKGLLPPCASVSFVSGTLFLVNDRVRKFLQPDAAVRLTYAQMCIAGGTAGVVVGAIVQPFEILKLNRQIEAQKRLTVIRASGAATAAAPAAPSSKGTSIRGVLSAYGPRGLFYGLVPTIIREIGTFGIFFPTNEYLRDQARVALGTPANEQLSISVRVLCAGAGGVVCWLPLFPIDQVKTTVQTAAFAPGASNAGDRSMAGAFARLWREGGRRRLFRGLTPCLVRAFPAYAMQYTTYEALTRYLVPTP